MVLAHLEPFRKSTSCAGLVGHEATAQGSGGDASPVQHDHGDEALGVVEPPGGRPDPADGRVVRLRDPIRQFPFEGGLDGGSVVPDRPGQLHEVGEAGTGWRGGPDSQLDPCPCHDPDTAVPPPLITRDGKQVSWLLTLIPNLTR